MIFSISFLKKPQRGEMTPNQQKKKIDFFHPLTNFF